jgi:hypothetical protein
MQLFLALSSLLRQQRGIEKTRIWLDYFLDGNEKKRMVRKISGKYKKKILRNHNGHRKGSLVTCQWFP